LQDNCINIGSKQYQSPDEVTQEKDGSQVSLIKKELTETDSMLLVWLSSFYNDKLRATDKFSQQPASGQFFLLGMFPYLSYKELDPNWQTNAAKILKGFIDTHPGRSDLFEAYAAQGLPLNDRIEGETDQSGTTIYGNPIHYIASNFDSMSAHHGKDTVLNLIRLLVKLGADSGTALYYAMYKENEQLEKLLVDLGAKPNTETLRMAIEVTKDPYDLTLIERLLKMGAKPGDTLCLAAKYERNNLVDLLLKYGAKKNVRDKHGKTPYDYAKELSGLYDEMKMDLKPYSFRLLEYITKFKREHEFTVPLLILSILIAIISGLGIYFGCLAIFDRLAEWGVWKTLLWAGGIAVTTGFFAYLASWNRGIPPIFIVALLVLAILGFGFYGFTPKSADKPPYMERIWHGEAGKRAPVEEIIIEEEE
jgi:hypothetical protein